VTTKSINLEGKEGYKEPLYARVGHNSYLNAVGLENAGAKVFKEELSGIQIPENKFLLISIFGGDVHSFFKTAQILAPYADGFELNMSCPHAKGYGLQIGNDIELVSQITKEIAENFDIPVFVKLSASIPDYASIAGAVIENGAAGITVTNAIGPNIDYVSGMPILSNVVGGLSGESIRPIGLMALRNIRKVIGKGPIVIGMGGVFNSEHVESYYAAGADFFGVGSALTNLNTAKTKAYFNHLQADLIGQRESRSFKLDPVDNMRYQKCLIEENTALTDVLHKIKISRWNDYEKKSDIAGKFYFLMIPGIGEKPFALFSYDNREFIIKNVGYFTNILTKRSAGEPVFLRGPYGNDILDFENAHINFVAGGTGISPVYEIAKKYSRANNHIRFFLGGKIAGDIFDSEQFEKLGEVHIATEDGSIGTNGNVAELLKKHQFSHQDEQIFINVGPKAMITTCCEFEKDITDEKNIWVSIEYHTSCGVGICGKCATEKGTISCVDGPFLRVTDALKVQECKHIKATPEHAPYHVHRCDRHKSRVKTDVPASPQPDDRNCSGPPR